jgi:hypothetical protein
MLDSEDIVKMSVNLTQTAIEHTATFSIGSDDDRNATVTFMEAMYAKLMELAVRHLQAKN